MTDANTTADRESAADRDPAHDSDSDERSAFDVPPDRTSVDCAYCGRPFENEGLLALHRGQVHSGRITDEERAAYEEAYEAESGQLRRFRLKALAALVLVYFGLLMVYAVV